MSAVLSTPVRLDLAGERRPRRLAVPRTLTTVLLSTAIVASLAPSLLPRPALVQALVTGTFAAAAFAATAAAHRLFGSRTRAPRPGVRRVAALLGAAFVVASAASNVRWQNGLRTAMDFEPATLAHWVEVLCGSVSVCAVLVVAAVGVVRGARRLGLRRATAVVSVCVTIGYVFAIPLARSSLTDHYAAASERVDPSVAIPLSYGERPGASSWEHLGREGRKFVSGGADGASVRTYAPLGSAPTAAGRANVAVDELQRTGGFDKSHVVVAVPTGSGWIDENAVVGWEQQFRGDVATVAVQYSEQPSWVTFLFARQQARDSAAALLDALTERLSHMPEESRPALLVYGQSLGAIGASAAVASSTSDVCGSLWAGPPAGQIHSSPAGSATQVVTLANSSDPVVWWSTDLIDTPPDLSHARVDAPVPGWLPVVTFVQTTVDMLLSLTTRDGHGHRYGTDQGTSLPSC